MLELVFKNFDFQEPKQGQCTICFVRSGLVVSGSSADVNTHPSMEQESGSNRAHTVISQFTERQKLPD